MQGSASVKAVDPRKGMTAGELMAFLQFSRPPSYAQIRVKNGFRGQIREIIVEVTVDERDSTDQPFE